MEGQRCDLRQFKPQSSLETSTLRQGSNHPSLSIHPCPLHSETILAISPPPPWGSNIYFWNRQAPWLRGIIPFPHSVSYLLKSFLNPSLPCPIHNSHSLIYFSSYPLLSFFWTLILNVRVSLYLKTAGGIKGQEPAGLRWCGNQCLVNVVRGRKKLWDIPFASVPKTQRHQEAVRTSVQPYLPTLTTLNV